MPGFIGMPEIILLGLLALLLFGPKRLPEMGRGLGKGLREFKSSVTGDQTSEDAFDVSKLAVADEEPVAVDHANAA
jgi:sec-independent protein translocase protein TatA